MAPTNPSNNRGTPPPNARLLLEQAARRRAQARAANPNSDPLPPSSGSSSAARPTQHAGLPRPRQPQHHAAAQQQHRADLPASDHPSATPGGGSLALSPQPAPIPWVPSQQNLHLIEYINNELPKFIEKANQAQTIEEMQNAKIGLRTFINGSRMYKKSNPDHVDEITSLQHQAKTKICGLDYRINILRTSAQSGDSAQNILASSIYPPPPPPPPPPLGPGLSREETAAIAAGAVRVGRQSSDINFLFGGGPPPTEDSENSQ
jgi:hypothetical protein